MKAPSTCIDCHVHYYPSEVSMDPASFARAHGEPRWESVVSPAGGKGLQAWADETRMLADMDVAGVDEAWLQGWYWQHPHTCALQQRWYAELLSRHPKRLHAFTPVAPGSPAETQALLQCAEDHGFSGIGEVHPTAQGFELDDPWWLDIATWAQEHGWPILLHVTELVGRHYEPRWETSARALQGFIERFPDLRIILAHAGGLLGFQEHNPYIRKRWRNVFYDTAALPLLYDLQVIPQLIAAVGSEKLLYGSDYPLRIFPASQAEASFQPFVDRLRSVISNDEDRRKVLGANAQRLIARA